METPPTPFYVFIEHILQVQPDQQQPPIHLLRLIPEMGHLSFVCRVRRNQYDRLRLPWHFVRSINKCQKNPLHLEINLQASKYQSPAFESTMPEYYFPKCQRVIVVKFSDRKDRHDFVLSLKADGLILETKVAHEYVPQTLEFKLENFPQQITKTKKVDHKNGKQKFEYIWKQNMCIPLVIPRKLRIDETQVYQLEDLSHEERKLEELRQKLLKARQDLEKDQDSDDDYHTAIGEEEEDLVEDSEDDYYTAIGENEDNSVVAESSFYTAEEDKPQDSSVKSEVEEEEEYVVFDEENDLNYPRIVFEIGLGRSAIRPLKFSYKSDPEPTCFERICL